MAEQDHFGPDISCCMLLLLIPVKPSGNSAQTAANQSANSKGAAAQGANPKTGPSADDSTGHSTLLGAGHVCTSGKRQKQNKQHQEAYTLHDFVLNSSS
ncbi:hypothetical protein [Fundidesulfovibrio putealis]|uniref:hypothetical protein n=1 Tax=Fundidesulfovibrio putealis TaxID=270496 RepID=UPI0012EB27D2|nr:hypothetical protein [Fundidesulfovibrio putealis]